MKAKIKKILVIGLSVILVLTAFTIAIAPSALSNDDQLSYPSNDIYQDKGGHVFFNSTKNASANGSATFLKIEGYNPWAALIVNSGDSSGVDLVTASFENDTLIINAQDSNETNHATVLVNKGFADKYINESESNLEINLSDAVNYHGLNNDNETVDSAAYVFHIEHFSRQFIRISPQNKTHQEGKGEMHRNRVENASANGSATFLKVDDYKPWAALVVNAGSPEGVDLVKASFENGTLIIKAQDSNETNHVNILINKGFADKYLANSEGDIDINVSDAVNYKGMEESNDTADSSAYVFHIEHFSTQTIEISKKSDFEPPVDGGQGFTNKVENASANGAATFLRVEGYKPWAALIVNAGNPDGVDRVTATFENETLIINARDSNETNHVTILVNKEFADKHLADSEGDLDINVSYAVNYEGLDEDNKTGDGGMYVFHIEHFSTQTIKISEADKSTPFIGAPLIIIGAAIPVVYYSIKKRTQ